MADVSLSAPTSMSLAVIGDLVDTDLVLAELLLRQGVDVCVFRKGGKGKTQIGSSFYTVLNESHIRYFDSPIQLLVMLRRYQLVYSITSSLFFSLSFLAPLYRVLLLLGWPRHMVVCSGSNITERAVEWSLRGILERLSLRSACYVVVNNYPWALQNASRLRIERAVFLPFPYAVDPPPTLLAEARPGGTGKGLRVFHPSHLDWGETDSGERRNSTKGSDRFLRAFIVACRNGLDAHCTIIDRGSDRETARRIISEMEGEPYFSWRPNLTRAEYHAELMEHDLIIDQFDVGAFGGIAVEAMAHGKPVMAFVERKSHCLGYNNDIPVIPARTEAEISDALWCCQDRGFLQAKADEGRRWVQRYYDPEVVGYRYLCYAQLVTGRGSVIL